MKCPSCGREGTLVERGGDAWCTYEHRTVAVLGLRRYRSHAKRSETKSARGNRLYHLRHRLERVAGDRIREGASNV